MSYVSVITDTWLEPGFAPQPMAIPLVTQLTVNGIYVATKMNFYITHIMPGDPPIVHMLSRASSLSTNLKTGGLAVVLVPGNLNCGANLTTSNNTILTAM